MMMSAATKIGREVPGKLLWSTQTTHNNNDKRQYIHAKEGQLGLLRGGYGHLHGCCWVRRLRRYRSSGGFTI
ncbi:hypothetical protein [Halorubrum trueperi]|uniref:Uncharacterized protein n=1 Tax=Halorubrum trueperi TaxID=2004704 RepID=A0ABD5UDX3_9EURY